LTLKQLIIQRVFWLDDVRHLSASITRCHRWRIQT